MAADAVGGVWTYALDLARELAKSDVEVALAVLGPAPAEEQRAQAAAIENVCLYECPGRLEWMPEPWKDVRKSGRWLLSLEEAFRPDVVHLNGFGHAALPWRAPKIVVFHSCVQSWWRAVKNEPPPGEWDRYYREVAAGLRAADAVVAPTDAMLATARSLYGELPHARTIPNGRDLTRFQPRVKEPFVFCAGRLWDEAKNLSGLEQVSKSLPWPVKVAGSGPSDRTQVEGLGRLTESQMSRVLGAASIYALPAKYEPFGLSVLEAAQSGCALVLGDIASLRENWAGAALFVPPHEEAALASALRSLIADESARLKLGSLARRRAAEFDIRGSAARYLETYCELTERATAGGRVYVA